MESRCVEETRRQVREAARKEALAGEQDRMLAIARELEQAQTEAAAAQQQLRSQHAEQIAKLKDEHEHALQSELADALRATNDMRASLRHVSANAEQEQQDKHTPC